MGPAVAVTIIMRTRERRVLLRRALEDVCTQSWQDWHLVVVNDGGDPGDVEQIVSEQSELSGRVTILHNEVPRGRGVALNQALSVSESQYIAIHDDDDTWHPSFLATTIAQLEATGEAAVAVRTEIVWERVDGSSIVEEDREIFMPDVRELSLFHLLRTNRYVPISTVHRREVHDEIGLFREDVTVVEDWEFLLRLAQTGRPMGFIDSKPLAFWHQRPQASGTLSNSVFDLEREHRRFDLLIRDEALREHARRYGLGALLYFTGYFQREFDHVHGRLRVGEGLTTQVLDVLARQAELLEQQRERLAALERATLAGLAPRGLRRVRAWRVPRPESTVDLD
jgi:glycosyltransferase involved in cell wall biosynthesis